MAALGHFLATLLISQGQLCSHSGFHLSKIPGVLTLRTLGRLRLREHEDKSGTEQREASEVHVAVELESWRKHWGANKAG